VTTPTHKTLRGRAAGWFCAKRNTQEVDSQVSQAFQGGREHSLRQGGVFHEALQPSFKRIRTDHQNAKDWPKE